MVTMSVTSFWCSSIWRNSDLNWCVRTLNCIAERLLKLKVKLSLCLTKHHAMKTDWGSGGIAPRILDLGARRRWVVSFTPRSLYSQGEKHRYPLLVGWVGPTAGLNTPSFNILVYFSNFCGFSTEIDTTASLKG